MIEERCSPIQDKAVSVLNSDLFALWPGVLDEKASACEALGIYASHTGAAFMPYITSSVEAVETMSNYFVEDVRQVAYRAMGGMVKAVVAAFPPPAPSQHGPQVDALSLSPPLLPPSPLRSYPIRLSTPLPLLTCPPPLPTLFFAQVTAIVNQAAQMWLTAAANDEDKGAVAAAMDMIAQTLGLVGAAAFGPSNIEAICAAVQGILKGEATCQAVDSDGERDEEEEEESDAEEILLGAACDVMPALAKALGPQGYAPAWAQHFEALMRHLRGGRPEPMRAVAVGAIAEVGLAMESAIEPYVARAMPQVLRELRSAESGNRRNAAFCVGVLCRHGGREGAGHYMEALRLLHPLFQDGEDWGTRDNAAGAVARIVAAAGPAVPLDKALPLVLGALPLQEDLDECVTVYGSLADLLTGPHAQSATPFLPAIIGAFGVAAHDANTPEEAKGLIGRTAAALHDLHPEIIRPLVERLTPEQQQALVAASALGGGSSHT